MPVSDKTRKILWARSGNRCAKCRVRLVIDATIADAESVVGQECHIVSAAKGGPRHDPAYPADTFDAESNLILLCAIHHKMADDQPATYTAVVLRKLKQDHAKWVETTLGNAPQGPRLKRIAENMPQQLPQISSGKELLAISMGTLGHYLDHDDDLTDAEVDLVGGFAQEIADWRDLGLDDPIEQVRTRKRVQDLINELAAAGFHVFAAVERQRLEGGVGAPSAFPVLHLSIFRKTNPNVVQSPPPGEGQPKPKP